MHMTFQREYDKLGYHRLNILINGEWVNGEWESYQGVARNSGYFMVTEYYLGHFVPDVPYKFEQVTDFTIDHVEV